VTVAVLHVQEIDTLLAGGLTSEDEDDVMQELEQIIKVGFVIITDLLSWVFKVCLCKSVILLF